eukprot:gene1379-1585_t
MSLDKCNRIIKTLSTMTGDFERLKDRLGLFSGDDAPSVWNEDVRSRSSLERKEEMPIKWSDRLRQAMEALENKEQPKKEEEVEQLKIDQKIEFEDRQEKARAKREQLVSAKIRKAGHKVAPRDRVQEFQHRTAAKNAQAKQVVQDRAKMADHRHDEHISLIKNRANEETKKVETCRWISDHSTETDKFIARRKLEKQEARRNRLAASKSRTLSEITKREEAAAGRRRAIEAARAQILLGCMPIVPPIDDDPKRKIRRFCKLCNVPITSERGYSAHLAESGHTCRVGLVTMPFDSLSSNLLAPLSKETIAQVKAEEMNNSSRIQATRSRLATLVSPTILANIQMESDYFLASTFQRIKSDLDGHIAKHDLASLQYLLLETSVLIDKYSTTSEYLHFTKFGGLFSLANICFIADPRPPPALIKTSLDLIKKLCTVPTNVLYLISAGTVPLFIDLFSSSILTKPDIAMTYLPTLISLIRLLFSTPSLIGIPSISIRDYKVEFVNLN